MIVLEWLFLTIAPCDAAEPWQLGSQDAATPMMQGITDLHHDIFFFLILILVFVSRILVRALWHFHYQKNPIPQRIVHGTTIERNKWLLHLMNRPTGSQNASSSSSKKNKEKEQKDKAIEKIRLFVIEKVTEYIEKYEGDLITEFPKANLEIKTNTFTNKLVNSVLEEGDGLCGKFENLNLPQLRQTYESFKEDFDFIDEYKNNLIYSNIRVLLKKSR